MHFGKSSSSQLMLSVCEAPHMLLDVVQVNAYMFGSVPLRTYLPDGDIDLSVFCAQDVAQSMRDTWAVKLQGVIEQEQSNGSGPYKIGDITVINAEVGNRRRILPRWACSQWALEQQRSVTAPCGGHSMQAHTQKHQIALAGHVSVGGEYLRHCCLYRPASRMVACIGLAATELKQQPCDQQACQSRIGSC